MIGVWVGLLGILIGTATDIKKREVPDWINYGMIVAGLGLAVLHSLARWSFFPFLMSLLGLAIGWVVGAAMYYTGQWGGGDAKMMMGLGALLGLPVLLPEYIPVPFFLVFLLFSVFAGAAYGLVWMLGLSIKHRKAVAKAMKDRLHQPFMMKVRIAIIVLASVLLVLGILIRGPIMFLLVLLAAISYATFYMAIAAKAVEQACFVQARNVSDLVEGDWIVNDVKKGKKVVVEKTSTGVTKKQIALLKKHKVRSVIIKEGIPFVPSFLIAYLAAMLWVKQGYPLLFWV